MSKLRLRPADPVQQRGHGYDADRFAVINDGDRALALDQDIDQFTEAGLGRRMREARDAQLPMPKLIVPSLQVNMRAGNMPEPDDQGDVFLKLPINKL